MAKAKPIKWDAPDGFWYTQRSIEDETQRQFLKALRSPDPLYANQYVLWTDEQKAVWEEMWLDDEPIY